jgi:hypothetical protein
MMTPPEGSRAADAVLKVSADIPPAVPAKP